MNLKPLLFMCIIWIIGLNWWSFGNGSMIISALVMQTGLILFFVVMTNFMKKEKVK